MIDLAMIWAGLIAFAVLAYVILDGFDLGIGIIFPFLNNEDDQDLAMNTVAPVWDGNETWLILGGGGLFAVFPLAYSVVMPALYMPIILMLLGLVFRGVAFEFHWRSGKRKHWWDRGFFLGSTIATLCQGIALGALVQGIAVTDRAYSGGWWDWLTPFSIATGIALVIGYALLGSTWLILKTEGGLQRRAFQIAWSMAIGTMLLIVFISLWTPTLNIDYLSRWYEMPNMLYLSPMPILIMVCAYYLFTGLKKGTDRAPFFASIGLFVLSYVGLCINFFPHIVPPSITIWEAAAPDNSLKFLLVGAVFLLPMILGYTFYAYWVFRGKIKPDEAYH